MAGALREATLVGDAGYSFLGEITREENPQSLEVMDIAEAALLQQPVGYKIHIVNDRAPF